MVDVPRCVAQTAQVFEPAQVQKTPQRFAGNAENRIFGRKLRQTVQGGFWVTEVLKNFAADEKVFLKTFWGNFIDIPYLETKLRLSVRLLSAFQGEVYRFFPHVEPMHRVSPFRQGESQKTLAASDFKNSARRGPANQKGQRIDKPRNQITGDGVARRVLFGERKGSFSEMGEFHLSAGQHVDDAVVSGVKGAWVHGAQKPCRS